MMSRSSSARVPKTWKMSFPSLVVVSMASCKLWKEAHVAVAQVVDPLDEVPQ
jgi:hypothetical protein